MAKSVVVLLMLAALPTILAVDNTRVERENGAAIVQAVIDLIQDNCIYSNDRLFLRRLAYVESRDGTDPDTFRAGYFGGIWQVRSFQNSKTSHVRPVGSV